MTEKWIYYTLGPMLLLFVIGFFYLMWYLKKRRYDKDLDHLKTLENIKKSKEAGTLSEEDYKIISDAMDKKN